VDPASAVLSALALGFAAAALWSAHRATLVTGVRRRLAWIGRALALVGAAVAVWFPAELYGELGAVVRSGSDDVAWLPRAIWYSLATTPLAVAPALVALRSVRAGALLFGAAMAFHIFEAVARPLGVIFPDAGQGPAAYLFSYGPPLLTAVLLGLGRDGPAFESIRAIGQPAQGAACRRSRRRGWLALPSRSSSPASSSSRRTDHGSSS